METHMQSRSSSQTIIGFLIVLVGVLFLLDNLDIIELGDVFRYWPVLIIALGLVRMTGAVGSVGRFIGLVITVFGVLLLLEKLYVIRFHFWEWWPLILVAIGGSLLLNSRSRASTIVGVGSGTVVSPDSTLSLFACMSGFKRTVTSDDFRAGDLTAIMGGCEVDFRQASIKNSPATINCFTFWGGINLKIPSDWTVSLQGVPILGGFDDKTHPPQGGYEKRLVITGQAIMGGVEITN
jgi:predicted membrane protein